MRFISFIKQNAAQTDPALKSFADYAIKDSAFPLSSDPGILAFYLYNKLDEIQTKGFQVFMMLYKQTKATGICLFLSGRSAYTGRGCLYLYRGGCIQRISI